MRISDWSSDVCSSDLRATDDIAGKITAIQQATKGSVFANQSIQQTIVEVQTSAQRIRDAMDAQAQTVTSITAAVEETALAADRMSSTIASKIGRASCRERVCQYVSNSEVGVALKKKEYKQHTNTN